MEDKKKRLTKIYYYSLIILSLGYAGVMLYLNSKGIFKVGDNIIPFIVITVVYYLIMKNSLSGYIMKKMREIDPELKAKGSKLDELKKMAPTSDTKWYKSGTFIYVLVIVAMVTLFYLYQN